MDGTTFVTDPAAYASYHKYIAEAIRAIRFRQMMEHFCEQYPEYCNGVVQEFPPDFHPPVAELAAGSAIANLLGAIGYVGPDQEGGPDPNGPWGPVIRDSLVAMSIVQLSGAISDREAAQHVRKVAADLVQRQAAQLQEVVARY